jgi:hypothetical protein
MDRIEQIRKNINSQKVRGFDDTIMPYEDVCYLLAAIDRLTTELAEWDLSFKLFDDAMRRGTNMFREKHPEYIEKMMVPSADKLALWLLERIKELEEIKINEREIYTHTLLQRIEAYKSDLESTKETAAFWHKEWTLEQARAGATEVELENTRAVLQGKEIECEKLRKIIAECADCDSCGISRRGKCLKDVQFTAA